jgi:hypothetical protein
MALAPNPEKNLTLPKAKIYFDKKNPTTGLYEGYRDLGEAPEITTNITPDKLPFYSSRGGMKSKVHEIVKELALKLNFSLAEPNDDNLSMVFMADKTAVVQASATGSTKALVGVKQGRYYKLGKRSVTVTEVALTDTPATTYLATSDFTVDATLGRIYIVPNGNIADDADITVTFDVAEKTYNQLQSLNQTKVEGSIHIVSDNPAGVNYDIEIWRASLIPTGSVNFISDDWMSLSFETEVLKDETGHPNSPYMDINIAAEI